MSNSDLFSLFLISLFLSIISINNFLSTISLLPELFSSFFCFRHNSSTLSTMSPPEFQTQPWPWCQISDAFPTPWAALTYWQTTQQTWYLNLGSHIGFCHSVILVPNAESLVQSKNHIPRSCQLYTTSCLWKADFLLYNWIVLQSPEMCQDTHKGREKPLNQK